MSTTSAPSTPESTFTIELAAAKAVALRSLLETLTTTDDPVERRRIATAILRIPDPDAPARRAKVPRIPAAPEKPDEPHVPPQTPLSRLAQAIDVVAHTDDETIRTFVLNNAGDCPDFSYASFKRIMAGGRGQPPAAAPDRAQQARAAGP